MDVGERLKAAVLGQDHLKMMEYFEQLKTSDQGLEYSATSLLGKAELEQEELTFFHWKVLEHHIQFRYAELPPTVILGLRKALLTWLQSQVVAPASSSPTYLRNKSTQVFALLFAKEFLSSWPQMMYEVMKICLDPNATNAGVDFYLRFLLAIDLEVVDRSVVHTEEEQTRNTNIKDTMRETCIPDMVQSWYNLLLACSEKLDANVATLSLHVIGAYIEWIDINMIANEKFLSLIFNFMSPNIDSGVREAACDCLREIALKGMLPMDKLQLIKILWPAIQPYCKFSEDDDIDYVIKLSKLVGGIGSTLIYAWNKLLKLDNVVNIANSSPDTQQRYVNILSETENKTEYCMQFLGHEDDDVSQQCIPFALDYIDMLKKHQNLTEQQKKSTVALFQTLAKKFKYDAEFCFENEGEEEAEFKEYLKGLKVALENLIQLQPELIQEQVLELLKKTLENWRYAEFNDVEVAIRLTYHLGESLPSNLSNQFTNDDGIKTPLHHMLNIITSSGVSDHPHAYVRLMFFETVVRYDRYFVLQTTNENVLLNVTQAFLDHRGIKSANPTIRSRCAYLLSRFIKTTCKNLQAFTSQLLEKIQELLVLSPSDDLDRILSSDDQLFMYELAGTLIVNTNVSLSEKNAYMTALLRPLVEGFNPLLKKMHEVAEAETRGGDLKHVGSQAIAKTINYAMSYASRTSKAFSNKHTMAQAGCSDVYTQTLTIFLNAFEVQIHHDIIHSGIRQYLHRMVICLEEEVLPFVPIAVQHLMKHCTARALHQFIPLINQILNKFKKSISPFLHEVFMPIVRTVFQVLSQNQSSDGILTEDAKSVRRTYFQFLHALISNGLPEVILNQEPGETEMVLMTMKQGAVEYPDPMAQKLCFNSFHKLIDSCKQDKNVVLQDFITHTVVPACFQAPLQPGFDFEDAQTMLVLKESSSIMKDLHGIMGNELIQALQIYLSNLKISETLISEYCQALVQLDPKQFRTYTKIFFQKQIC